MAYFISSKIRPRLSYEILCSIRRVISQLKKLCMLYMINSGQPDLIGLSGKVVLTKEGGLAQLNIQCVTNVRHQFKERKKK